MTPKFVVTTSWDDGHPADAKLAALLAKYGIAATFYVPTRNSEGRPVLEKGQIRQLSAQFEIGGHTTDHVVLTNLPVDQADQQIRDNKRWLEDVTARPTRGFCYVRGRYNHTVKDLVENAGFEYARTGKSLRAGIAGDRFELPTTIQLYPHDKVVYFKNLLRDRLTYERARLFSTALASAKLVERIDRTVDYCRNNGGYFHLWGHSWEIEERGLWNDLEIVLRRLAEHAASTEFLTNHQVYSRHFSRDAQSCKMMPTQQFEIFGLMQMFGLS